MIKVGLTGGIGSGKTFVCKLFEQLGVPVYYADDRAKYLMQQDGGVITAIKKTFGDDIYENEILNRSLLANLVFNNADKLAKLNGIVHPAVFKDTQQWLIDHENVAYTLREAALIYETGMDKLLDKVIVVTAPYKLRLQRAMQRDNATEGDIITRINNQLTQDEKEKLADYIIVNDGIVPLLPQIEMVHQQLIMDSGFQ